MSTNLGIGLSVTRPTRGFDPARLFANGEQGAWYDPSDFATLYQDSAGTTPVTQLGQPVGLMLDKSGNGHHASQSGSTARPTVQARVNMLERTEGTGSFDFSPWLSTTVSNVTHSHTDPFGGTDAAKIFERNAVGLFYVQQPQDLIAGIPYTVSVWAKASERDFMRISTSTLGWGDTLGAYFDLANGTVGTVQSGVTATISDAGGGWYRCSMTKTPSTGGSGQSVFVIQTQDDEGAYTGDPTKGIFLYGVQLEPGSTATTYQRVTTATDYADIGLPRYLEFDGVDDAMATQSVDFSASDEITVVAGAREEVASFSPRALIGNLDPSGFPSGIFLMYTNDATGTDIGGFYASLGTLVFPRDASFGANNTTQVLTGLANNATSPYVSGRVNGSQVFSSTTSPGAGTFASDKPIIIGARYFTGTPTSFFSGKAYQMIVRAKTTSGALLDQTERFVARKTGVTL